MARDEVRAILGEPHGTDPDEPQLGWYYYCDFPEWTSDPLNIDFDENGRVDWISR
jgi:outer membrane protein assembly factor BamE (lipoprotein component of BamABCDE complex)